ncbi:MAG: thiamine pyrophosphate-binding protein, partial [bacterium]
MGAAGEQAGQPRLRVVGERRAAPGRVACVLVEQRDQRRGVARRGQVERLDAQRAHAVVGSCHGGRWAGERKPGVTILPVSDRGPGRGACDNPAMIRTDRPASPGPRPGGRILVDQLLAHGASRAFCVPGESFLAVLDALHDVRDRLPLVVCRQEGGAANMAEAWGKLTGEPGICFATRGPGAT